MGKDDAGDTRRLFQLRREIAERDRARRKSRGAEEGRAWLARTDRLLENGKDVERAPGGLGHCS